MNDEKALAAAIARLADLQEQQLAKLTELTTRFKEVADAAERSHKLYAQQAQDWEEDRTRARERQEQHNERMLRRGAVTIIIFALIPVAIIVARFL